MAAGAASKGAKEHHSGRGLPVLSGLRVPSPVPREPIKPVHPDNICEGAEECSGFRKRGTLPLGPADH